jgi:argininosuccinate lyase
MSILAVLKGLPLAYCLDLQEDKAGLFDSADTLLVVLAVMAAMLPSIRVNSERTQAAASESYTLATDVADYLVRQGLPFREAHGIVGQLVRYADEEGKSLSELTLEEYRRFSPLFDEGVLKLDVRSAIDARDVRGGTSSRQMAAALRRARRRLEGGGL